MSTAAARIARADTQAPRSELTAHGSVEVNGSADVKAPVTRAGPPRTRTAETVPLSPAQQQLADHLAHLVKLQAEVDRTSKPVDRLREQLSAAMLDLQNSEHALAEIDRQHSAAIAQAARDNCCSSEPVESSEAENAVSRSRRHVNSIRQALEEVNQDQIQANANLEAAKTRFDQLALDILVEEFAQHLPQWALQRDQFHLAEIDMLGLLQAIGQRGRDLEAKTAGAGLVWLRTLEKMQPPWHHLDAGHVERGGPREVSAASSRWSAVVEKLRSDAGASF